VDWVVGILVALLLLAGSVVTLAVHPQACLAAVLEYVLVGSAMLLQAGWAEVPMAAVLRMGRRPLTATDCKDPCDLRCSQTP
jgi:hypothetical protein